MRSARRTPEQDKRAAVEQWTDQPCGSESVDLDPGGEAYFRHLLQARRRHAPWIAEILDYAGARGLRVLDVGCGQGIDLANYALAGARPTGIDLTPRHVELARAHLAALGLEADVVVGDAERLPFPDASFDRVSSNGVLHHTPDMPAALREMVRVLEPGADARVIVYNRSSLHFWCNQILLSGILQGGLMREGSVAALLSANVERCSTEARPLVAVSTPRQVRAMLRDAGFVQVRTKVRHLHLDDAFPLAMLASRVPALGGRAVLDRLGRVAGWYVIGFGQRHV